MKYLGVDNFTGNSLHSNTMILFEEHSVITDNKEIVDIRNNYFVDITKNLGPKRNFTYTSKSLESIIHIFRLNESFHRKKLFNIQSSEQFHFSKITQAEAELKKLKHT